MAKDLQDSYLRTHRILSQRLDLTLINRLCPAVITQKDQEALSFLRTTMTEINACISSLPIVLDNSDLTRQYCRINNEGNLIAWSWHRWKLDIQNARTLNSGDNLPLCLDQLEAIPTDYLGENKGKRILASRLLQLESVLRRGMLREGITIACDIKEFWERLKAFL